MLTARRINTLDARSGPIPVAFAPHDPVAKPENAVRLTVVAPTYNEAANVRRLSDAVAAALEGCDYELLFVDDSSPDGTGEQVEDIGRSDPRVRLLRRTAERGLSHSVIDGFSSARGEIVACIDADLQHDPAILPAMLHSLTTGCDLVVGSRYVQNGRIQDWSWIRQLQSRIATNCARLLLGVELLDPMSGFFMMRRSDFLAIRSRLNGKGFKILLDIVAALKTATVREIPYTFRPRTAGESKLSSRVVMAYLEQLWQLSSLGSKVSLQFLKFVVVGGMGAVVNLVAMMLLIRWTGYRDWRASTAASTVAALHNYLWNNHWTFRDRRRSGHALFSGAFLYFAISAVAVASTALTYSGLLAFLFRSTVDISPFALLGVQLVAISVGTYFNYTLNKMFTWQHGPAAASMALAAPAEFPPLGERPARKRLAR
jgi:dolichol-phosphate mannosyltransferase